MEQMLEAYAAAAVRAKDVDAFLNLYANDARGRRREGTR